MPTVLRNACLVVIGNEILSGRTEDKNIAWLARALNEAGVQLKEVRVIPDVEAVIVATVGEVRRAFDYVFTTGGIGPTHDDITTAAIAKAFGVPVVRDPAAEALLKAHYEPHQLNAARLKMADIPQGAALIANPVSAAPGFVLENVYVMAGVPAIMQAMFDGVKAELKGGAKILSRTVVTFTTEGTIAEALTKLQAAYPDVDIGSYPFMRGGRLGTSLVTRGIDERRLKAVCDALARMLTELGAEWSAEDA